jgi:cyclohexadieny/prephenate dehydrogenase
MLIDTIALVGVGLIGGSIGLAARKRGIAGRILGVDNRPEVLRQALTHGVIDQLRPDIGAAAAEADAIVFCTPVDVIAGQVVEAALVCRSGALLTDAGSTKAAIVRDVEGRLPQGAAFVGGHPLAGSEKQGPEHASTELFEGRVVVLTPTARTNDKALSQATALWEALGARVRLMDPEEHDRAMAMTSHLPHVTAAALAGVLPLEWSGLTAGGFRDATRVASGGPELWAAILQANADGVLDAMDQLDERMAEFRRSLASGDRDALMALLQQGKQLRDGLAC